LKLLKNTRKIEVSQAVTIILFIKNHLNY